MIKIKTIGITGQNGFIGYHLFQTLNLLKDEFSLINFNRNYFENNFEMDEFVRKCDVIIHLAGLNRHNKPEVIYDQNLLFVNKLIQSLDRTDSKAHIIFSSSTQEDRNNIYGNSKREARVLLSNWATKSGSNYTGMLIPNVFGPFGTPFYNSVIATFCYQLSHDETPKIETDSLLNLIYVGELVNEIIKSIRTENNSHEFFIKHTTEIKVSEILTTLHSFQQNYQELGIFPSLKNNFELNLFNTFRSFIECKNYFPKLYVQNQDSRGSFVELCRNGISGQTSFSFTYTGITRGNHFHTRKIERFAVIKGQALIQLRKVGTNDLLEFKLDGNNPSYVDMPIWYTHNITNIGKEDLYTVFWINEPYNPLDPDTFLEKV